MVRNGFKLLETPPIIGMVSKRTEHGVSYGLSEAGYDIRIKQEITFDPYDTCQQYSGRASTAVNGVVHRGSFVLASAMEEFKMPTDLVGIVHDKSTWARQGLSVFNTVIEPGFIGGLTLELVYHGSKWLHIPAGSGIAQIIFHELTNSAEYNGKYQNQSTHPESSRFT